MAWTAENRAIQSARSKAVHADPAFRAMLSAKQKARWEARKVALNAPAYPRSVEVILASAPRLWNRWYDWKPQERVDLMTLCADGLPLAKTCDALGREPGAIIEKARQLGLEIPQVWRLATPQKLLRVPVVTVTQIQILRATIAANRARLADMREAEYAEWKRQKLAELAAENAKAKILWAEKKARKRALVAVERARIQTEIVRRKEPLLQFPYINKPRDEHAELMAVNALVPKGLTEWIRADICQEIMLALLEGKTSLDELKKNRDKTTWFIRKFFREQMPRQEVSLETDSDGRNTYDIAASRAIERNEIQQTKDALLRHYTPATQEAEVYRSEIAELGYAASMSGDPLSIEEIQALLTES